MATAVQKITLSSSRDIPFNKLVLSQSNVRRVKAGISVEELAESIARRGLIQSLHVRPVVDAEGKETGMFEVPAGGRRFRALELLVKQKRLAKTAPVPCVVSEASADVLIDEVSLAENIERAPLHPLDQFRAFQAMREKGMTEEAIAAAFFVDAKVVKQRLRLVSVSPALLDIYAEDGMTLEQLMAFTVSSDHARQEQVWDAIKDGWQKEPYYIRRLLTETTVRAADKRAVFVGIAAYEEAGGCVLRDLFQQDDGGWLQDPVLLDRLVGEKLKAEAEAIAAEGWKWTEVAITFPYGHDHGLRQLVGATFDLSEEERATREALRDEYDRLEAEYGEADELPGEIDARLGEIEQALETFERRPMTFEPEQIGMAGVFISIDADGELLIERGYVRAEDETPAEPEAEIIDPETGEVIQRAEPEASRMRAVITLGGHPWSEGALFQVYVAPGQITTIALEPGESLTGAGPIAAGDTARWIIGDTESGSGTSRRVHILVKPTREDISTNLVISTDRRVYLIELRARAALYMPAVAWAYPALTAGQRQTVPAAPIIPVETARNYRYGLTGDTPPWRPISVFDDGRRVYVVFPRGIVQGEMPPIFVIGSEGETQIVNSRIHQNILIVDRLFGAAELRLGSGDRQQTVRIVRVEQRQAAQPAKTGEKPS